MGDAWGKRAKLRRLGSWRRARATKISQLENALREVGLEIQAVFGAGDTNSKPDNAPPEPIKKIDDKEAQKLKEEAMEELKNSYPKTAQSYAGKTKELSANDDERTNIEKVSTLVKKYKFDEALSELGRVI